MSKPPKDDNSCDRITGCYIATKFYWLEFQCASIMLTLRCCYDSQSILCFFKEVLLCWFYFLGLFYSFQNKCCFIPFMLIILFHDSSKKCCSVTFMLIRLFHTLVMLLLSIYFIIILRNIVTLLLYFHMEAYFQKYHYNI